MKININNAKQKRILKIVLSVIAVVGAMLLMFAIGMSYAGYLYRIGQKKDTGTVSKKQTGTNIAIDLDKIDFSIDKDFRSSYNSDTDDGASDKDNDTKTSDKSKDKVTAKKTSRITLGFTGCMLFHEDILNSYKAASYDFNSIYKYISDAYGSYDCMSAEFEGTVSADGKYSGYPSFKYPASTIDAITGSGVDVLMCATNHMLDNNDTGLSHTLDALNQRGINYAGIKDDDSTNSYKLALIDDIVIGFMDYTYSVDGALNSGKFTEYSAPKIDHFDIKKLDDFYKNVESDIAQMKKDGAEFIVLNLHWGEEYHLEPETYQKEMAQKLSDMGVNALIGGHPHCIQPMDVVQSSDGTNNMLVIYSTGNALSNQVKEKVSELMNTGHTEDGVILGLTLEKEEGKVSIAGVDVTPTWCYRGPDKGKETFDYYILPLTDPKNTESMTGIKGINDKACASYDRTMSILKPGLIKARSIYEKK